MRGYLSLGAVLSFAFANISCTKGTESRDLVGSVRFDYSGGTIGSGSFNASGALMSMFSPPTNASWAAGEFDEFLEKTRIVGLSTDAGGTTYDHVFIDTPLEGVGDDHICALTGCDTHVSFDLNIDASTHEAQYRCYIDSGTLTIASFSETRMAGTITGSGTCVTGSFTDAGTFTITGGTFDVPIVSTINYFGF